MKKIVKVLLSGVTICVLVLTTGGSLKVFAATTQFSRTLTLGSSGDDVLALQKILNQDPSTRIQGSGPGSLGQETTYFGSLTQDAVIRFQEKHAQNILYPAGLTSGTGVVGPATRAFLASVSNSSLPVASNVNVQTTTASQNPNFKNADKLLATIDKVAIKQGVSAATLATIHAQVIKDLATTTDLRATFLKIVDESSHRAAKDDSFIGKIVSTVKLAFDRVFRPEQAQASLGIPFGGALLSPFFCTCSDTWLIALEPLPPSFAVLLTYVPFTQGFLSYNIPFTPEFLGTYVPGAGVCLVYAGFFCFPIPAEGMITPMTGSAPL